jgi:hypothetical protein
VFLSLLILERVIKRSSFDNLTKVAVDALSQYGGLLESNLAYKIIYFGANDLTIFQRAKTRVSTIEGEACHIHVGDLLCS